MSVSRHPVALRLERQVGEGTRLLATVMALPLLDGIFPALVLAGALTYPFGILETGLLIFGGSATVAVILAEMDGTRREQVRAVALLGVVLIPAAALEAALAPTIQSLLDMAIFQRFAGLVILAVAAKTASAKVGDYLPRPAVIIGLGMVAAFRPEAAELVVSTDPMLVARAAAAAGVGVGFALAVALLGPRLRGAVDIDRFRFGSAVALGMLALSVLQLMPTQAPVALGVLVVTAIFSVEPSGAVEDDPAAGIDDGDAPVDGGAPRDPDVSAAADDAGVPGAVVDASGGAAAVTDGGDEDDEYGSDSEYGFGSGDDSRAPWL